MKYSVSLTDSAVEDLDYFRKNERRVISDGIALFLTHDANVETRRRKPLRPNRLASWELRIEDYRVFYDFEEDDKVKVVAVGYKEHNDLYVRGKKVEL
jgi:mRNA-degrading endonuclease RelE of RelBE toxin-antitoxin system